MLGQKDQTAGPESRVVNKLGFWNDLVDGDGDSSEDPGAIRILVCGNTGLGKSSLINKVFGIPAGQEVTKTSNSKRGIHNVKEELKWEGRTDLIIHDSGGFEAAGDQEFNAIDEFLREKSSEVELN